MEYIIRETKSWKIKWYECWTSRVIISAWITIFAFVLVVLFFMGYFFDFDIYFNSPDESIRFFIKLIFYILFFIFIIFVGNIYFKVRKSNGLQSARDFKINWKWYSKKLKVSSIENYAVHNNSENWYSFYGHYFVLKDWDVNYYSNAFQWWKVWWVSKETLSKIYNKFWYDYDDNETNKNLVLREYDKNIEEINYKREHWWLFEKIVNSWKLYIARTLDRSVIEKWYIPPYLQVWDVKVTVWDSLDIYKDYDLPENYWVDIDFLTNNKENGTFDKGDFLKQKANDIMWNVSLDINKYLE